MYGQVNTFLHKPIFIRVQFYTHAPIAVRGFLKWFFQFSYQKLLKVNGWCPYFIAKVEHQFKRNAFLIFQIRKQTVSPVNLKTAAMQPEKLENCSVITQQFSYFLSNINSQNLFDIFYLGLNCTNIIIIVWIRQCSCNKDTWC